MLSSLFTYLSCCSVLLGLFFILSSPQSEWSLTIAVSKTTVTDKNDPALHLPEMVVYFSGLFQKEPKGG